MKFKRIAVDTSKSVFTLHQGARGTAEFIHRQGRQPARHRDLPGNQGRGGASTSRTALTPSSCANDR
jgi:hypothetical protein